MINNDAIRLLDWYYQQPDILTVDEEVLANAPEVINKPDHKPDPILSREVLSIFWRPLKLDESNESNESDISEYGYDLLQQIQDWTDRTDTYFYKLQDHPIIEAFRKHFDCPEDLEYYEILDLLFWRLGTLLSECPDEPSPAEFLENPEENLKDRELFLSVSKNYNEYYSRLITNQMKEIRLDFYDYRVRKGRAYILLSPVAGAHEAYRIPSFFARKEDRIDISTCRLVEDNGDLVLYHVQLRKTHTGPVRDGEWVPLDRIRELRLDSGNPAGLRLRIFDLFLEIFREEKGSRLYQTVARLREATWPDVLREHYADELQNALDGRWSYPNLTPPDPERVREELRTLAHFRRHLPKEDNPMRQFDVMDWYEPIDWIALGSRQQ